MNTCKEDKVCKCPLYAALAGEDPSCTDVKLHDGGRKFDPTKLSGKGCKCATPKWVPTEKKLPHFKCPVESYFNDIRPELPDFAATALEWCNSKHVPADKLVPESLRGLYWMKGSNPKDVAFCTTRAEWDPVALTAKLSPWTDFVWRKRDNQDYVTPWKHGPLVYTLTFTDATLKHANITTNSGAINMIATLPLIEVDQTDDGLVVSKKKGDVFARPSRMLGHDIAKYFAVRIVDDAGNVHPDWYKMMSEEEHVVDTTNPWFGESEEIMTSFVRYDQECSKD